MARECMLTTVDNPYNPFDQFTLWWLFDVEKGYNSCGRLMRIADLKEDMSEPEEDAELERAMDALIQNDFLNVFKKVVRQTES